MPDIDLFDLLQVSKKHLTRAARIPIFLFLFLRMIRAHRTYTHEKEYQQTLGYGLSGRNGEDFSVSGSVYIHFSSNIRLKEYATSVIYSILSPALT